MSTSIRWRGNEGSVRSNGSSSRHSDENDRSSYNSTKSYSTAHTAYSTTKPSVQRHGTCFGRIESNTSDHQSGLEEPRTSVETYASTAFSEEALSDDDEPAFELVDFPDEGYKSDAIPATPKDFADLFPSSRRLAIHHDDSTADGNMNLRVDTRVRTEWSPEKQTLTLFHLKMNDLRNREFSLRRYCRESGREVCNTARKYQSSVKQRPVLARSLTAAMSSLKRHRDDRAPQMRHLKRNDSGYESIFREDLDEASVQEPEGGQKPPGSPTNAIKLDFSNYAQVDVTRRGSGARKCHQYEYWGHLYTWKRVVKDDGEAEEVSFHLYRNDKSKPLAHIIPVPLTRSQAREERLRGGWVPPCSMWITDQQVVDGSADVADVIIASGLIALVDDTIKRRWHSRDRRRVLLPLIGMNMEYVGPRRLIDEVFNRRPMSRSSAMSRCS